MFPRVDKGTIWSRDGNSPTRLPLKATSPSGASEIGELVMPLIEPIEVDFELNL